MPYVNAPLLILQGKTEKTEILKATKIQKKISYENDMSQKSDLYFRKLIFEKKNT